MQITLDSKWTDYLLTQPESGMGYQRVRIRLKNGQAVIGGIVFNAEILRVPEGPPVFSQNDIASIELEPSAQAGASC